MTLQPVSGQCNTTSQCQSGLVVKQCYDQVPWSNLTSFCECSSWYGFVGERCDEVTAQVWYSRISLPILALWSFVLLLLVGMDIVTYMKWKKNDWKQKKIDPVFFTAIFSSLGVFSLLLHFTLQIGSAFVPTRFEVVTYNLLGTSIEEVSSLNGKISTGALGFASGFYLIASLQISLSWIHIADSVVLFINFPYPKTVERFKIFVRVSEVVYLVLTIVFIFTDFATAITVITPLMGVILGLFFAVGRKRFVHVLDSIRATVPGKDHVYLKPLMLVKRSSRITIVLQFLSVIPFITFGVLVRDWPSHVPIGNFNFVLLSRDIGVVFGLVLFSCNHWYTNSIFLNLKTQFIRKNRTSLRNSVVSVQRWESIPDTIAGSRTRMSERRSSLFKSNFTVNVDNPQRKKKKKSSHYSTSMSSNNNTLPRKRTGGGSLPAQSFAPLQRGRTLSGSEIRRKSVFDKFKTRTESKLKLVFDSDRAQDDERLSLSVQPVESKDSF